MNIRPQLTDAPHDPETVRKVVEDCKCRTRILYEQKGGFFSPKLRSINDMEPGRSNITSNPIVILLEWLVMQYALFKAWLKRFFAWLFPRRDYLWCNRVDSHLTGRIIFGGDRGRGGPIHNLHLEFWGRTWLGAWRKLGVTRTDHEGRFRLPFDLREARRLWLRRLSFEVHTTTRVYFRDGNHQLHYGLWWSQQVVKSDLIGMDYNLHTIPLDYWLYRENALTPRAHVNAEGDEPEHYTPGRVNALLEQIIPIEYIKLEHIEQMELDPGSLTIQQIQSDYPMNLTTCIEKHLPGYTRGDDWFGERMMNGMNRACFQPDPDKPGFYHVRYFGKCWYDCNEIYALPEIDISFTLKENGLPKPEEIRLTGCLNAQDRDPWKTRILTPADEPGWTYAKRIARVSGAFNTEVEEHFAGTHLNAEQFAVACYRNLRLNPLAALLMPHMKEVSLINHAADAKLIGGYIQSATALTKEGLDQRTRDILGVQDWKGWKPREVLSDAHLYARAETLFFEVVSRFVDDFFEEWEADIKAHWFEVYRFSEDLINHAVPVAFSARGDAPPDGEKWQELAERRLDYYALQYAFDRQIERPVIDGQRRALSRITAAKSFDEAGPEDWQNIRDACKYAIMIATFMHTWINEMQYDDLGEILYSCGGLRYGDRPEGIMAPEEDTDIAPDLLRSTQMLWFTNLLSRTEYGFITRNEEGDVNPRFSRLLEEQREAFSALGVDIDDIELRTNI